MIGARRSPSPAAADRSNRWQGLRAAGCLGAMALLSACAGGQSISGTQEAAQYEQRGPPLLRSAPGPRSDPWGPYVHEASAKYDVPGALDP